MPFSVQSKDDIALIFDTLAMTAHLNRERTTDANLAAIHKGEMIAYERAAALIRQTTLESESRLTKGK